MKIDHTDSYKDFGEQFVVDSNIDGYHGSLELLKQIVRPFEIEKINGKVVMEVGSGSGRILNNIAKLAPERVVAVEPSKAIEVAKQNNAGAEVDIKYLNVKGEDINLREEIDYCFSIGVLHHIPNVDKVVKNIFDALKPEGEAVFWFYGFEGNELYVLIFNNLRRLTRIMPDFLLRGLCSLLNVICSIYIVFIRCFPFLRLPMKDYLLRVFRLLSWEKRNYVIFDQLNPSYSKYYRKKEVEDLVVKAGFSVVNLVPYHAYSWTVVCKKTELRKGNIGIV